MNPSAQRLRRFGFAKELRLLRGPDFQRVFDDNPRQIHASGMILLAAPNQLARPRLGLIISRKACASSVGRNRIKRVTRESFRHHQALLCGGDIIAIARHKRHRAPLAQLRASLEAAWPQLAKKLRERRAPPTTPTP